MHIYSSRKLSLFLLFVFVKVSLVNAQVKITMQQAIDSALKNNLQIRQALLSETGNYLDIKRAEDNRYPTLNASLGGNLDLGKTLDPVTNFYIDQNAISSVDDLNLNFTIFQGLQKLNQIKKNKLLLESNKSALQKLKNDLTIEVITNYLALLNYKDELTAAQQQYNLALQQVDFEKKKFDVGKTTSVDMSRAEYQVSKEDANISNLKNELSQSNLAFVQLLNVDPRMEYDLIEPVEKTEDYQAKTANEIFNEAVKTFPEIKEAEFDRLSAVKDIEIARGGYFPVINLSAAVASNYIYQFHYTVSIFDPGQISFFPQLHQNMYEYIGFNINIPIFNGFNTRNEISKAKIALENADINKEIVMNNLLKVINQAVSDLYSAEKNYSLSQKSYESAKNIFEITKKRYDKGLSNSFELNQTQNDMNNAEFILINNKYNLIFKAKVVDFYSGTPISF